MPDELAGGEIKELDKARVVAPGREQPLVLGSKHQTLDEPVVFVARELVRSLALLPVEDFDASQAAEMIDIANLAHAADG